MKAVLICPSERPAVCHLSEVTPLATVPIAGKCLVEYWLEHLVNLGAQEILVLVVDRPEHVRAQIGNGERWGLRVEVLPQVRELTAAEARQRFLSSSSGTALPEPHDAILMERLPGLPEHPLFESYEKWFGALAAWIERADTPDRVGVRQIQPGVWAGLHTHISPEAELRAPCWIGQNVRIESHAVIGPAVILEDRVVVADAAEISQSVIGPETMVGKYTSVKNSLAWGSTLIDWRCGSCTTVPDPFLLSSLNPARARPVVSTGLARLAAFGALLLTLPFGLLWVLRAWIWGEPAFRKRMAVRPTDQAEHTPAGTLAYFELNSSNRWLRRWPQLWSIVCGDFAWVGNRPLQPGEAAQLSTDFERLWLRAPIGLFSLADAEGCIDSFDDEARAHSSFYAAGIQRLANVSILADVLMARIFGRQPFKHWETFVFPLRPLFALGRRIYIKTSKP